MRQTVIAARDLGVAIGAHPGFPDRQAMGRKSMAMSAAQITEKVRSQIQELSTIAMAEGVRVAHVKPHGALYHQASECREVADAICRAVADVDPFLLVVGLSGGRLLEVGATWGLRTISEVFADRNYMPNGGLVPRGTPNALLLDPELAAQRVLQMIQLGTMLAESGDLIRVCAETVCIHGDHPRAIEIARAVVKHLCDAGIVISAFINK